MVGGYIYIPKNERGNEALSKTIAKSNEMPWKTIGKEVIHDHYTLKHCIQRFTQIAIGNNKLKLFVDIMALKPKAMSIPGEFRKNCNLKS
jgi:hypothetical protein